MKTFFLICILFVQQISFCQTNNFAPIGAKWWYEYSIFSASGYMLLESTKDTVIDGVNCRAIENTLYIKDLSLPTPVMDTIKLDYTFIYSDSGKVYNYTMGSFYKLYDFNANVGDTWNVGGVPSAGSCDSIGQVRVDSIGTINIGGTDMQQIYTSSTGDDYWNFTGKPIIENIGSLYFLLPAPSECLIDFYQGGPLRCYYDNTIGYYQIDPTMECDFISQITDEISVVPFNIWPNPVNDKLNIACSNTLEKYVVKIYNLNGQLMISRKFDTEISQIEMSQFAKGIYLVQIQSNSYNLTYKIFKS